MSRLSVFGFVSVALVTAMVFGGSLGVAQAAPAAEVALSLEGQALHTTGSLLYDSVTMVSLKDLAAEMGFTYKGPGNNAMGTTYQATVTCKDKRVTFNIGSSWAVVNGHEVLCTAPILEGDKVMVPLRFLAENMGFQVIWTGNPMGVDLRRVTENPIVIGTVRERQETSTLRLDLQYPKIAGLDPAVQGQLNAYFSNRTGPVVEQAHQAEKENVAGGWTQWPTEAVLNYTVTYNQQDLLCILFDDYLYTGGAHGMTGRHGYTVDLKTGTSYALKDLFKPGTDYVSLISAEVAKQIEARDLATLKPFTNIRDDQDFYIKDGDLVVYFQQYELMAYAYGFPEFKIPMASLGNVLVPEMAARTW